MSKISRHKTRKILFQILYARTYGEVDKEELISSFFNGAFKKNLDMDYMNKMYSIILENERFLLEIIKRFAPKFDISIMAKESVFPVLIAASEMLFLDEEIPSNVSINEAIELAKFFGDRSNAKFVNGVMDSILKNIESLKYDIKTKEPEVNFSFFKSA